MEDNQFETAQTPAPAKKLSPKIWIPIAAAVVAIIVAVIIALVSTSNTYETPLKLYMRILNNHDSSAVLSLQTEQLNGFCEDEINEIFTLLKNTDQFEDFVDDLEDSFEKTYGNSARQNRKFTYRIESKRELERETLHETESLLELRAVPFEGIVEGTEDFDSEDWEDLADDMDLTVEDTKQLIDAFDRLAQTLDHAEITEGYALKVVCVQTGSDLDEPRELEESHYVYKINGRWVGSHTINTLADLFKFLY